jgi:cell division protein YceG involved in septum cleavage
MSLKNKIMKLIFITFIVIMWNGCAETIYYNANLNKNFKIDEKNKFYIIEINSTTQEEKKFTNMLKNKMIQNGYKFIDKKSTDYAIFVKLGEIDFNFNPKKT